MFQNVQDVFAARFAILVENEKLGADEANIAIRAIKALAENSGDDGLMTALENAMWLDKTIAEDENDHPVHPAPSEPLGEQHIYAGGPANELKLVRDEGIANDGLTDAEATAALDEHVCSENCPPA